MDPKQENTLPTTDNPQPSNPVALTTGLQSNPATGLTTDSGAQFPQEATNIGQTGAIFTEATPPSAEVPTTAPTKPIKMSEREIQEALAESGPTQPHQTMVLGLNDEKTNKEEKEQTLVTGLQYAEDTSTPIPIYTPESRKHLKDRQQGILKIVIPVILAVLLGVVALAYYLRVG
ncbi:hypothetical protein BH23PAT2_BH23PAT2_03580 [soil metagenome]